MAYTPHVNWTGPTFGVHLRVIDGVLCLFDESGRMMEGVFEISAFQDDSVSRVTVEVYPDLPPEDA